VRFPRTNQKNTILQKRKKIEDIWCGRNLHLFQIKEEIWFGRNLDHLQKKLKRTPKQILGIKKNEVVEMITKGYGYLSLQLNFRFYPRESNYHVQRNFRCSFNNNIENKREECDERRNMKSVMRELS